ncbi:MAG: ABC transporter permease, partial [Pyrinomonadaceae bacterium]|nr:ABC transporter permease [Pyrinomonadaceae bacterium]
FLAVVKREYLQRVRSRMFIAATLLGPLVMSLFGVVPALIFSINAGDPLKIAVVDQTGKLYSRVYRSIMDEAGEIGESPEQAVNANALNANGSEQVQRVGGSQREGFELYEVSLAGRAIEQVRSELGEQVRRKQIDGYLILPPDLLDGAAPEFYGSNTGDVFTKKQLEDSLSRAVREERLAKANIDVNIVRELSRPVKLQSFKIGDRGEERDTGAGFVLVFAAGFVIYLTILMYGQVILGAVIEEKETRIAEILFSSVKPFPLMMGKLIGISLLALTQLAVWGLAFAGFVTFAAQGLSVEIPDIAPVVFVCFALFFLMGYFIYATIYAFVGSMVTTAQEGGVLAMPIILLLVIAFYMAFPVIRSPDSSFAFWASMFPFFSPITMLVRIVTKTPPLWQIGLSLLIGFGTVILLTWLAARIYRIGMLMYGKRATIPEVWRWVRQA